MAKRRDDRLDTIRAIVRGKRIHTQEELAAELQTWGLPCGSGTVSRDMAEVGMRKVDGGFYVLESDLGLYRMVSAFVTGSEAAGNLVAIRAGVGVERGVAAAIDGVRLPDVMCSATGEGSVLVACRSENGARRVCDLMGVLM